MATNKATQLWYRQPAADWNEALPLGNGRLGSMVYGTPACEQLQVNEDSVWYGGPMERNNPSAKEKLAQIRQLIIEGRIHEAERLCKQAIGGTPQGMRIYQTLGDISIDYDLQNAQITEYERSLDVAEATARVHFRAGDTVYERTYFISAPAGVMVMCLTAKGADKLNLEVLQTRHHIYDYSRRAAQDTIILGGNLGRDGLDYAMLCKAVTPDGEVEVIGESIVIRGASRVLLYWSAGTTYRMEKPEQEIIALLEQAAAKGYEALYQEHIADYHSYYDRMSLTLAGDEQRAQLPTDERLAEYAKGASDRKLEQLYFNFGRYLMISCSRPGTLPATLQGIWNKDMEAPWDAKYTININTEMNYWCAEPCDLGDCHLPLFELLKKMLPNGRKTAQEMYGCRGFVAHHNTDIWGDTAPQDLWIPGSFWVMGGAWLCTHIWMHYEYTRDRVFLQEMFPIMREAAQFFLDFCIEYKGYLCTCPSVSPENTFILPNGGQGANSIGVTMDNQILRDLFSECHEAAQLLGIEDELDRQIQEACARLLPTRIGSDGRIMEWCEEYEEKEKGHRHISHLYGLHPSCQITKDGTPKLAEAAALTLSKRLENGGGHTGWSRAWIMNHYAKLWDGEKAYENLRLLLTKSTLKNLFDNHPPFQIDGNFGSIAAMTEMLVQSDAHRVVLLPALPSAWTEGAIDGVCARGGLKLRLSWAQGVLQDAQVLAKEDIDRRFVYADKSVTLHLKAGEWVTIKF